MRATTVLTPLFLALVFAVPAAGAGQGHAVEFEAAYSKMFQPSPEMNLQFEYVFRDGASWCDFWDLITSHASLHPDPTADCPAVDFRRAVLVAEVGFINGCSGGFQIASAERVGRTVTVFVEHTVPCPEWACAQVFFGTVQAVVIPRPVGDIEIAHETAPVECAPIDPFEPPPALPIPDLDWIHLTP